MITVGDLFSGIGGFSFGLERTGGFETKWFVEQDEFCQKILTKHWPKVPKFRDIKDCGKHNLEAVDLICGGFPCQPFSSAGKRKGKEDDRHLWPEMLRIISELKPTWVVGENVAGFISLGLDDCLSDLENQGYETQAFIIPACAVNAPHRRDRVWIVAYAEKFDDRRMSYKIQGTNELQKEKRQKERIPESGCSNQKFAQNSNRDNAQGVWKKQNGKKQIGLHNRKRPEWEQNWLKIATELCRVDDGVSPKLHRVDRLKALGNAVVSQIPEIIGRMILESLCQNVSRAKKR